VAAVQVLGQAYDDYYATVADYDRAQFRLYHALGHPPRRSLVIHRAAMENLASLQDKCDPCSAHRALH